MKLLARVLLLLAFACMAGSGAALLAGRNLQALLLFGAGMVSGMVSGLWWDRR